MNSFEQVSLAILVLCGVIFAYILSYGLASWYEELPKERSQLRRSVILSAIILLLGNALIFGTISLGVIISHLIRGLL